MEENRRNFRLREFLDITWKLDDQDVSGEGTIINISSSGVLLQTDRAFKPLDHSILSFDSGEEILPFEAKKGRIVWFRQIHTPQERLQCGIEFISGNTDKSFNQWYEEKVNRLSEAGNANILGNLAT